MDPEHDERPRFLRPSDVTRRHTWGDVERRARSCPILSQAVRMVALDLLSREDALVDVAIFLSEERDRFIREAIDRRNNEQPGPIVLIGGPPHA